MNWSKAFVLAACLAVPSTPVIVTAAFGETSTPAAKSEAAKTATPMKADEDKDDDSKMSEADKRAKAIDCSKKADAKGLHGEARKKFRSACKRGK